MDGFKQKTNNFIAKYESKTEYNKEMLFFSVIMLLMSALMLAVYVYSELNLVDKIVFLYISITLASTAFTLLSISFFQYRNKSYRLKYVKCALVIITLPVCLLLVLPILTLFFILKISKFINVWNYPTLYTVAFLCSLFFVSIIMFLMTRFINDIAFVNHATSLAFIVLVMFYCSMRICVFIYFKIKELHAIGKNDSNHEDVLTALKSDYIQTKKEIYLFAFVIIAVTTMFVHLFNMEVIFNNYDVSIVEALAKGIMNSFVIIIAIDRLRDKWRKKHSK